MSMKSTFVLFLLLFSFSSNACKCVFYTDEEKFDNAIEVLHVLITSTELLENSEHPFEEVKASYKILERFKGSDNNPNFALHGLGNCSIGFMSGHEYILYISRTRQAIKCTGSSYFLNNPKGKNTLSVLRSKSAT